MIRRIALTFDDGPTSATTRLLQILDDAGGHATFFAIGQHLDEFADQACAVVRQGSDVWGHGWDHTRLTGPMPGDDLTRQIIDTREAIERITGVAPPAFRPPYGDVDDLTRQQAARAGQAIILWSLDSGDWRHADRDQTVHAVLDGAHDGAIVLCHESCASTPAAMAQIVPQLVARGFQLVTVAELLGADRTPPQPGRVYDSAA
jgi:peptidoglycan/xylan/chitin deacetylase (PgdA/CDA1 family)